MLRRLIGLVLGGCFLLMAHPMGNFSVSHYAKFQVTASGVDLKYVLDLAEIPTSALFSEWQLDRNSAPADLKKQADKQAREWLKNLSVSVDGKAVSPLFESAQYVIADGAGGLPIIRVTTLARIPGLGGVLSYEDHNFPERSGWKEIVIAQGSGATLKTASQTSRDVSQALTKYPADPLIAPPQDVRAEFGWAPTTLAAGVQRTKPLVQPVLQPKAAMPAAAPATMTAAGAPAGSVVKGDFLSRLLRQRELTMSMILLALGAAFLLGGAHALTPGHGKTIVAAYLVGSRGTMRHAVFLGAMVTFTHTVSVFALGLATLFLYRFIVPEKITEVLGTISGLAIVAVGAWMLSKRLRARNAPLVHRHSHSHSHHGSHSHSHSHVPDELSWHGLAALGVSGGLVPCESALVLLLGAIALNRIVLGLVLLLAFSFGLALVLVLIGSMVLYAKNLLPKGGTTSTHPLLQFASIASPAIVMVVGLLMTGVSLGWIESKWMIG
jgi:nickel/cobalt exporter